MADYLVTGGAGFIGSNVVHELARRGACVRVLDNFATGRRGNLAGIEGQVELRQGDVRDPAAARDAARGVRWILHFAALPSVAGSVESPAEYHEVNLTGTLNVLLAARDAGVERVVFSSSSAVYGDEPGLPKREDMRPAPLSPYAAHKIAGEYYCRIAADLYGVKTFCLRYFNVFGPRQNPASHYAAVIPRFIRAVARGEAPTIYGDGGQTRDFVYVGDVAAANLRCCEAPEAVAGGVYNIACGRSLSVLDLAHTVMRVMGGAGSPRHEPARAGDVRDSVADIAAARDRLGWTPSVPFEEGLRRTVEWLAREDA